MFIVPESVPANFPPTSMQAPQDVGITRSLQKLANPMASIDHKGSCSCVESSTSTLAPAKPVIASVRRATRRLPVLRVNHAEKNPQKSEPKPPKNSGRIPYFALCALERWKCSSKNVGSQVM